MRGWGELGLVPGLAPRDAGLRCGGLLPRGLLLAIEGYIFLSLSDQDVKLHITKTSI